MERFVPGQRNGAQKITGSYEVADRVRMIAQPWLLEVNGPRTGTFSLLLSNNSSTGGTCFGDSGGPNYLGTSMSLRVSRRWD